MPKDPMLFRNRYRIPTTRLPGWNYAWDGFYFVTICTKDRECHFGHVANGRMRLSPIGRIVRNEWRRTARLRPDVTLDAFVVMPNHVHGIIVINGSDAVETLRRNVSTHSARTNQRMSKISPRPGSLPAIIRSFKSITTRTIHERFPDEPFAWQPRYHDRIIRDGKALEEIRWYIRNNPAMWARDRNN